MAHSSNEEMQPSSEMLIMHVNVLSPCLEFTLTGGYFLFLCTASKCCWFRSEVPKLFIVPYPFKHSTSSCVPRLALSNIVFCHHCKPAAHTLYDTFIKHEGNMRVKNECEFVTTRLVGSDKELL